MLFYLGRTHPRGTEPSERRTDWITGQKPDPGADRKVGLAADQTERAEKGRTAPDTTRRGPRGHPGQEKETTAQSLEKNLAQSPKEREENSGEGQKPDRSGPEKVGEADREGGQNTEKW